MSLIKRARRGRITGGCAALAAGAAALTLVAGAPVAAAPADDELTALMNRTLGLERSTLVRIDADFAPNVPIRTTIELDGVPATLDLAPHSVRADGYRVYRAGPKGVRQEIEPAPVNTLRGTVLEDPGSTVAASVDTHGLSGLVTRADGATFWIEPIGNHVGHLRSDDVTGVHVVYEAGDVLPLEGRCGVPEALAFERDAAALRGGETVARSGSGFFQAELGCDADSFYVNRYGETGTQNRINTIVNIMNEEYLRDTEISHLVVVILLRTELTYTSNDSFGLLSQFRAEWIQNQGDIVRDVAHLFTGRNIDGSVIGRAWDIPGPICSTSGAYCFAQDLGALSCRTDLSAHELGHLWGAFHCDPCATTMRSSLGCFNVFIEASIEAITDHRDSINCLDFIVERPPNDNCVDAVAIGDGPTAFDTDNATAEGPDLPESCDEGGGLLFRNDVWYAYTASCDGVATAEVCDADFDTRLAVYGDDDCPGVFLACNDNACGEGGTRSSVEFPVEAGSVYLVRIGARFAVGIGTLTMSCEAVTGCREDLDGSGAVDFGDILAILSAWGPCGGCPEDLDGSGAADFGDILAVLSAWGPCP